MTLLRTTSCNPRSDVIVYLGLGAVAVDGMLAGHTLFGFRSVSWYAEIINIKKNKDIKKTLNIDWMQLWKLFSGKQLRVSYEIPSLSN